MSCCSTARTASPTAISSASGIGWCSALRINVTCDASEGWSIATPSKKTSSSAPAPTATVRPARRRSPETRRCAAVRVAPTSA